VDHQGRARCGRPSGRAIVVENDLIAVRKDNAVLPRGLRASPRRQINSGQRLQMAALKQRVWTEVAHQ
jgi:uncharacterized protein YrrD